jgi:bifunctional non-homologous end joining protein LigD
MDNIFVVQKHQATNLHYDFRLEIGNVLKSWAIRKGPPLKVGVKRLAIETTDHPLEYAYFSGIIPKGSYGAGLVEIWDIGYFKNLKDISIVESYNIGKIEILLFGKVLKGRYALILSHYGDYKNRPDKEWLLIKLKDL